MKAIAQFTFAFGCFIAGYMVSSVANNSSISDDQLALNKSNHQPTTHLNALPACTLEPTAVKPIESTRNTKTKADLNNTASIADDKNIESILDRLDMLRQQAGNGELVAQQFDILKKAIATNPQLADDLIDLLYNTPLDSHVFSTALTALQTLPAQDLDFALLSIAEQYEGTLEDAESREKFLALLTNTSGTIDSKPTVQALLHIVDMDTVDASTKLEALHLVQPHQLFEEEKLSIRTELTQLIDHSPANEAAKVVPQLLRFSDQTHRSAVASDLLSQHRANPIRNAVLDSLASGDISATEEMKNTLMAIANNPNDNLNHEARAILEYAFELNKQEYDQLAVKYNR
ncbi:hypothetical protein [Saccharophagus degradans]|uniref:HEAT repeat domain-containing protein n=1 Tax=Saccharophagus degradans TaxID=86304 RepID=A0AAW7X6N2_9GAMM|nr:hypothetical protein [Saccharophagus degradans]MDO6422276.1 hypothetical protein [Saccharophagus degradans]MDO6607449.1 hypothetical protein [Saccharophagus degradans]